MLGKTLKILFLLQILNLLALSEAKNKINSQRPRNNTETNGFGRKQLGYVNENEVKYKWENVPYAVIHELKSYGVPKGYNRGKYPKKSQSWQFKYTEDNRDEPGFDLTPEEMTKFKIWKDGVIPYYIDVVSFGDKVLRDKIRSFLQMVNSVTSLNFVELAGPPADDNDRWVLFINRRSLLGCADHHIRNFTNQGVQHVVLGYDCIATRGELADAVMSIVGIPAQHNAPDRDNYITVNMENIIPDKKSLFQKVFDDEWLFHDLDYDFNSVTHYDIHKYSANGRATIELKKTSDELNPSTTFTSTDILKIKMLYNYIAKKKKIQYPVCEKMFKINSNYKEDGENKDVKPREKPSRYLGNGNAGSIKNNQVPNNDYSGDEQVNQESQGQFYEDTQNVGQSSENKGKGRFKKTLLKKTKGGNTPVSVLHALSDYDSSESYTKKIPLQLKSNTVNQLLALSDYDTDKNN